MKTALLIARRELAAYFSSMTGFVIIAAVLVIDGLLFNAYALGGPDKLSSEVLGLFFLFSRGTTIIASVFISMRLLAEERQTGTLVLLTSSPVHDREIVLGKWLSALAFISILTASTLFMPALIFVNGKVSLGHVASGYLGLFLLGAASLAVGTFGSALARTQVLAAIFSGCIVTALCVCWMLARVTERPFSGVIADLALQPHHIMPFEAGVIHVKHVAYYVMITYFALFAATRVLEARRWR